MEQFVLGSRVLAVCRFVESLGFDPTPATELAGIDLAKIGNSNDVVSTARFCDLFHAAAVVTGRSDFGLQWGGATDLRHIGPLATYMQNCASLREVIRDGQAFVTARNWGIESRFVEMGRLSRCDFHLNVRGKYPPVQFVECLVVTLTSLAREMLGKDWRPREVWFVHQPMATTAQYLAAFGCPVRFGMLNNAVVADTQDFGGRKTAADSRVKLLVGNILRESERRRAWNHVEDFKANLRDLLATGDVSINRLAICQRVRPTSLERCLESVGMSFRSLVTQVRLEIVEEELKAGGISAGSMARLGFSRQNAMNRFLKQHAVGARMTSLTNQTGPMRRHA